MGTLPLHVDVVVIGAGIAGVGAACTLLRHQPRQSLAVLEAREHTGGTWDLFRYPGIRSDSDMYTFGYSFHPWDRPKTFADGAAISDYVAQVADEHGLRHYLHTGCRVVAAEWSSATARWRLTVEKARDGVVTVEHLTCGFLFCNTGYYRYDGGHSPELPGAGDFGGRVVHPQHWPADLDHAGKRVVVIGSGATAATLVPALARTAAHVTMLQRSPGYVVSLPSHDPVAERVLHRMPTSLASKVLRTRSVALSTLVYQLSRRRPQMMREVFRRGVTAELPEGYPVDPHFTPAYAPWDQRPCLVPDGDLFRTLADGRASVVTDEVTGLTRDGVRLASGEELPADVVVTATGLRLLVGGDIAFTVDGRPVSTADAVTYKGVMLTGFPNLAMTIGYTNASWTLKTELTARWVVRLLRSMRRRGLSSVTALPPPEGTSTTPIIEMSSGYFVRARHLLPRQARSAPWRFHQNYARDLWTLRLAPVRERHLVVTAGPARSSGTLRWMRRVAQATMPGWSDSPGVH